MNTKETLLKAADLLETKGWTQGVLARGKSGRRVAAAGPSAVCFCAMGAIDKIEPGFYGWRAALYALERVVGGDVPEWNDDPDQTAENVIKTIRECAEAQDA